MRDVPSALQTHLNGTMTTTCRLLKISLRNGDEYGITTLNSDIEYESVTYHAANGFNSSVIATDSSYSVDNAEGYALLSSEVPGITVDMAKRGELDGATWIMYLVNWADLTQGHVALDAGDVGEVRVVKDTVFMPELVSYAMRLRQSIGHVDSITCRAVFGTDPDSQTGCGIDADAMWAEGAVSAVDGDEPNRIFTGSESEPPPARLRWLTGDNVSTRLYVIESADGAIEIFEPMAFPIQVGDTYEIRADCDKRLATCRDTYDNMINFKGEPLIPVGEASDIPGANV